MNPLNPGFSLAPPPNISDLGAQIQQMQSAQLGLGQSFDIVARDVLTISWDGVDIAPQSATFQHNLGYAPVPFVFFDTGGNKQPLPYYELSGTVGPSGFANVISSLTYLCDNQFLEVIFTPYKTSRPPLSLTFRYYLCREPAQ